MNTKSTETREVFFLTTDEGENNEYMRLEKGSWWQFMGTAWEPVRHEENELEGLYQHCRFENEEAREQLEKFIALQEDYSSGH